MQEFDDIRPYYDREVPEVIARLTADRELADTLLSMKYPRVAPLLGWALRPLIRRAMGRAFSAVKSIQDLQDLIGVHMRRMLAESNTGFTVSGLDKLDPQSSYLFISNHRDIAMDPAFVNLALYENRMNTVRIAIGDNLLTKPFSSDLMRLNKSFIVKRSATGRREKLQALTTLSKYISFSLHDEHSSIWIAQREGRAKDGVDRTEPALIKMLTLAKPRELSFAEAITGLNIIPVAISYELDPCDIDKGRELHAKKSTGSYKKGEHEDLRSIYKGIVGYKANVHVAFGEPLAPGQETAEDVAEAIDRQILGNYRLQTTNLAAWRLRRGSDPVVDRWCKDLNVDWPAEEQRLKERLAAEPPEVRDIVLTMYANPVASKLNLEQGSTAVPSS